MRLTERINDDSDNFAQAEKVAERILHRLDEGQVRLQKIQNNRT